MGGAVSGADPNLPKIGLQQASGGESKEAKRLRPLSQGGGKFKLPSSGSLKRAQSKVAGTVNRARSQTVISRSSLSNVWVKGAGKSARKRTHATLIGISSAFSRSKTSTKSEDSSSTAQPKSHWAAGNTPEYKPNSAKIAKERQKAEKTAQKAKVKENKRLSKSEPGQARSLTAPPRAESKAVDKSSLMQTEGANKASGKSVAHSTKAGEPVPKGIAWSAEIKDMAENHNLAVFSELMNGMDGELPYDPELLQGLADGENAKGQKYVVAEFISDMGLEIPAGKQEVAKMKEDLGTFRELLSKQEGGGQLGEKFDKTIGLLLLFTDRKGTADQKEAMNEVCGSLLGAKGEGAKRREADSAAAAEKIEKALTGYPEKGSERMKGLRAQLEREPVLKNLLLALPVKGAKKEGLDLDKFSKQLMDDYKDGMNTQNMEDRLSDLLGPDVMNLELGSEGFQNLKKELAGFQVRLPKELQNPYADMCQVIRDTALQTDHSDLIEGLFPLF